LRDAGGVLQTLSCPLDRRSSDTMTDTCTRLFVALRLFKFSKADRQIDLPTKQ
jgi:hypothetical protein